MCHSSVISWAAEAITPEMVAGVDVLEVGSYNVNGSVRGSIEAHQPATYIGADISAGPGVDIVSDVADIPAVYPEGFGLVVTTEMLEHVQDWRTSMTALAILVKPGGTLALSTRSPGFPYHAYPDDHWRYPVDTMKQILEALNLHVQVCIPDPEAPGVFAIATKPNKWTLPTSGALDPFDLPGPG